MFALDVTPVLFLGQSVRGGGAGHRLDVVRPHELTGRVVPDRVDQQRPQLVQVRRERRQRVRRQRPAIPWPELQPYCPHHRRQGHILSGHRLLALGLQHRWRAGQTVHRRQADIVPRTVGPAAEPFGEVGEVSACPPTITASCSQLNGVGPPASSRSGPSPGSGGRKNHDTGTSNVRASPTSSLAVNWRTLLPPIELSACATVTAVHFEPVIAASRSGAASASSPAAAGPEPCCAPRPDSASTSAAARFAFDPPLLSP